MFPILFEFKWLSIQTIWVFIVIAMLVSAHLAVKRLKRRRVNFNLFILHSTSFFIAAIVCSRVLYFFSHPDAYFPAFDLRTLKNFFSVWDQGLSFWGAFIGFTGMLHYRIWKEKEDLWKWYDALSVPFLVAMAIGNIGAFLGGFAYGKPTDLPWGVRYEAFNVIYTVPVHPTQIYALILILLLLASKHKLQTKSDFFKTDGNTAIYFATGFSWILLLLDFLRGDATILLPGNIRISTISFSLAAIVTSILLYKRLKSAPNTETEDSK
jgi:phosphatidylglycerol:prolipoprotein diacylglycerol transferase